MQPHTVGCLPYRSRMNERPDPRRILWENVRALMQHHWQGENLTRLANEAGVGPGTASRLKACETYPQINTIDAIAAVFDLAGWQLMVPGIEPSNPPVLLAASPAERRLYRRFLAFKKALENGEDEEA
jgi:hypothetical protein